MQDLYQKIESLSFEEFEALIHFVDKTRKERARAIIAEAQKQAARLAELEAVTSKKSGKAAKPPKYRDPNDASNTWSGFGRQPDWVKEHVAAGGKKEDLLIS